MSKYRFVPDYVADLVNGVCKDNDLTCLDVRKEGTYSVYVATVTDGTDTIEHKMGYDYALHLLPSERPAYLAGELLKALGWNPASEPLEKSIDYTAKPDTREIAEAFMIDPTLLEVGSEPEDETPKKPRNRGSKK